MSIFFSSKPKVTKEEAKKIRNELYSKGFNSRELAYVDERLREHLEDSNSGDNQPGIDAAEAKDLEKNIGSNPGHVYSVTLPPEKVKHFNEELEKYLKR